MSLAPRLHPPVHFFSFVLIMLGLHWLWPRPVIIPKPYGYVAGIAFVIGIANAWWLIRRFARAGTTIKPFGQSSALVTDGLFRYTRNPVYLGMVLSLAAVAALLGSLAPWFVIPVFVIVIDRGVIRHEEASLGATFGPAYEAYCQRVRRWI